MRAASVNEVNDRWTIRLVQCPALRGPFVSVLGALAMLLASHTTANAQEPPPRIGPFVVDIHGTFPHFPDNAQLAASRGVDQRELPGSGFGIHAGAHVYVYKWKAVTFGLGGEITEARAHESAHQFSPDDSSRAVTERFSHLAPILSFNFGDGDGWSYISGGVGKSKWSVTHDDDPTTLAANDERLTTYNYGGGARWFNSQHLAFSIDVRFYDIYPGTPDGSGRPGGPRSRLIIIGAGISLK